MHKEILKKHQIDLLPFIKSFKREFYLVGGTAIALQLGHRHSLDFDLFKKSPINSKKIKEKVYALPFQKSLIHEENDQIHFIINGTKVTFLYFPFEIPHPKKLNDVISFPDLLNLAAMKAYAIGRRAKWKDYVDMYFIIKSGISANNISNRANELFGDLFSKKLFLQQLVFFEDIDYTEEVEFIYGYDTTKDIIFNFLVEAATESF